MNFFTTLFEVCRGVHLFPQLAERSMFRVFWHYFVMLVICTLIITGGQYPAIDKIIRASQTMINEKFGVMTASPEGGINIANSPEKEQLCLLPGGISMYYLPQELPEKFLDFQKDATGGIIFSPGHIILWSNQPTPSMMPLPAQAAAMIHETAELNDATLREALSRPALTEPLPENESMAGAVLTMIENPSMYVKVLLFVFNLMMRAFETLPFILIFGLIFSVFGSFRAKDIFMTRSIIAICVYASMPPMLVASMFPALDLPILDFNTVFLFGSAIYTMIAINFVAMTKIMKKSDFFKDESDSTKE